MKMKSHDESHKYLVRQACEGLEILRYELRGCGVERLPGILRLLLWDEEVGGWLEKGLLLLGRHLVDLLILLYLATRACRLAWSKCRIMHPSSSPG